MMGYIVNAVNKKTGVSRTLRYPVETEAEAIHLACDAGYMVEDAKYVYEAAEPKPDETPKPSPKPKPGAVVDENAYASAERDGAGFFTVAGVIVIVISLLGLFALLDHRFQTGNAYGATANAIEDILVVAFVATGLVSGFLCLILASLLRLRLVVRDIRIRLLNQIKAG
jgi:hypothetical protein